MEMLTEMQIASLVSNTGIFNLEWGSISLMALALFSLCQLILAGCQFILANKKRKDDLFIIRWEFLCEATEVFNFGRTPFVLADKGGRIQLEPKARWARMCTLAIKAGCLFGEDIGKKLNNHIPEINDPEFDSKMITYSDSPNIFQILKEKIKLQD